MKVKYHGDPKNAGEGPEVIEAWGHTFVKGGDHVDVPDDHPHAETIKRNHHFHVEAAKPPERQLVVVDKRPHDPLDETGVNPAEVEEDEAAEIVRLKAELDSRGIVYGNRAGLTALRAKLQDAVG